MAKEIDLGKYLKTLDEGLKELYSDKIDLSRYKFKEETPKAYAILRQGLEKGDMEFISKGLSALHAYTNPDIPENEIMKNYSGDKVVLNLFYKIAGAVKGMADEISKAVGETQAHQEALPQAA